MEKAGGGGRTVMYHFPASPGPGDYSLLDNVHVLGEGRRRLVDVSPGMSARGFQPSLLSPTIHLRSALSNLGVQYHVAYCVLGTITMLAVDEILEALKASIDTIYIHTVVYLYVQQFY